MGRRGSTEEELVNASNVLSVPVACGGGVLPSDRPPFREVFEQHAPGVGRILRYLGVPASDLMDAAQDVFLVVDRRYDEFEGRSSLTTWIRQICVRVAFTYRRRRRRRREDIVAKPPEISVQPAQQARIEEEEGRALLMRLLDVLDDEQRAVVVLHDVEQLPMREVAEALRCPMQTAYSRRNAALHRLRREIALSKVQP